MSGSIEASFKNAKDKEEFLSLFEDCLVTDVSDHPYLTFNVDFEGNSSTTYMGFNSHYDNSIDFDYPYGGTHYTFSYFLMHEIAQKYDLQLYWDGPCIYKVFDSYNEYHNGMIKADEFNKAEDPNYKSLNDPSWTEHIEEMKRREDNLREVCKGFFENNKFKQYIWK